MNDYVCTCNVSKSKKLKMWIQISSGKIISEGSVPFLSDGQELAILLLVDKMYISVDL